MFYARASQPEQGGSSREELKTEEEENFKNNAPEFWAK